MTRWSWLASAVCVAWPAVAAAQVTSVVTPTVRVEAAHDTNILWRPEARADEIWRLSPALAVVIDSPRANWSGDAAIDAEWFARNRDLSTPFARQHAAMQGHVRSTERLRFEVGGAYDSGIRPAELNLLTGLTPGRVRGTRWVGSGEAGYGVTARTELIARGQSQGETTEIVDAFTQDAEARVRHAWSDRNSGNVRYLAQFFTFDSGSLTSHVVTAGWTRRVTTATALEFDGGVRIARGEYRPEIEAGATYRGQFADLRVRYLWTQTTALGVLGLVESQGGILTFRYDRPQVLSASIDAGAHFNTLDGERSDVYRFSGEILRPVIGALAIAAAWSFDHHRGVFVAADPVPGPILPGAPRGDRFSRHVVLLRLQVSGSVRSMAGPREPGTRRPGEGEERER